MYTKLIDNKTGIQKPDKIKKTVQNLDKSKHQDLGEKLWKIQINHKDTALHVEKRLYNFQEQSLRSIAVINAESLIGI